MACVAPTRFGGGPFGSGGGALLPAGRSFGGGPLELLPGSALASSILGCRVPGPVLGCRVPGPVSRLELAVPLLWLRWPYLARKYATPRANSLDSLALASSLKELHRHVLQHTLPYSGGCVSPLLRCWVPRPACEEEVSYHTALGPEVDTLELVLVLAVDTLELALVLGPLVVAVALLTLETELAPARLASLLAVGSFQLPLRVQRVSQLPTPALLSRHLLLLQLQGDVPRRKCSRLPSWCRWCLLVHHCSFGARGTRTPDLHWPVWFSSFQGNVISSFHHWSFGLLLRLWRHLAWCTFLQLHCLLKIRSLFPCQHGEF